MSQPELNEFQNMVYKTFKVGDLVEVKHVTGKMSAVHNAGDYHLGRVEQERFGKLISYQIKGSFKGRERVYPCILKIKEAILQGRHLVKIESFEQWEKIQKERIEDVEF